MPLLRNLRAKRLALTVAVGRKVTAGEIATQLGVTDKHWSNVEAGRLPGSEELALLAAKYFECDPAEILPIGWQLPEGFEMKQKPTTPPKQPTPTKAPPKKNDTKSPTRFQEGAA
ncbi:helix-turn-helix domain-containing protein [Amycolatopsis sp. NPDC004772]